MAEVRIIDPDDLTTDERKLAASYAGMTPGEFDAVARRFVDTPTDMVRQVLFCADLAQDTLAALGRLHAQSVALEQAAPSRSHQRRMLHERTRLIAGLRDELRPFVNLAAAKAADQGPRHRAERVLGQVRYPELRQIMADLEQGMSEKAAAAAHRARIKAAEST